MIKEEINICFESHIKIVDKTTTNKEKVILSSRIINDHPKLINKEEQGRVND